MRNPRALAIAVPIVAVLLAACGGDETSGGDGDGDVVELRYAFWGSDDRAQMTQEVIDKFEAEHPDIRISPDYSDFGAYWDKLATSVAAGDAPDIITMGGAYPSEYAGRGALLDLAEVEDVIRTDKIDDAILDNGVIDGALHAIPTGVNTYTMVANPAVFAAAGVEMPDDSSWTWDDYERISADLAQAAGDDVFGTQDPTDHNSLKLWARQHGEEMYTEDGELGISAQTVESWFEMTLRLRDSGGAPSAARTTELAGMDAPEQTLIGSNSAGLAMVWSNVLEALSTASGEELVLIKPPGESEDEPGTWLGPSMFYTISAQSEHPEEAATFIDYMLNEVEAAESFLTDRGLPVNTDVRAGILDLLSPAQQAEAEYLTRIEQEGGPASPPPPVGSTETALILSRLNSEVLFDRITPAEAAEQFISETEAAIAQ